jgi:hypothetical protein
MKLIDKNKRGFARYCPTFARAGRCLSDTLQRPVIKIRLRIMFSRLDDAGKGHALRTLEKYLSKERWGIAMDALLEIGKASKRGIDMSFAYPLLASLLNEDEFLSSRIVWALKKGVQNELSRDAALFALIDAFSSDDNRISLWASRGLLGFSQNGLGLSVAIPAVLERYAYEWDNDSLTILYYASKNSSQERSTIVRSAMDILQSARLMVEAEKNSILFGNVIGRISHVLKKVREEDLAQASI